MKFAYQWHRRLGCIRQGRLARERRPLRLRRGESHPRLVHRRFGGERFGQCLERVRLNPGGEPPVNG